MSPRPPLPATPADCHIPKIQKRPADPLSPSLPPVSIHRELQQSCPSKNERLYLLFSQEAVFQFLDKKPFSPDSKKRSVQNLIAFRRHRKQLHLYFRISIFNPFLHIFCLPKCQQTFSRGDYNLIFQQPSPFPYQD